MPKVAGGITCTGKHFMSSLPRAGDVIHLVLWLVKGLVNETLVTSPACTRIIVTFILLCK